ncbi:MAG TPA: class D sortase [Candidatus Polarisedimenticolia bacterium]|nr:class D sortase [Candidatus Polarisedimenticolia bacterium]
MFHAGSGLRRLLGGACMVGGAALLLGAASISLQERVWQEGHAALFQSARAGGDRQAPLPPAVLTAHPPLRGEALAHLSIPRLGIGSVVVEGTDPDSLRLGPGHLEGSALPGQPDNCIIAGHRDGAFRRLRTARPGDIVEITGRTRVDHYRIDSVETVPKDDLRPLAPSSEPILTLVTCYPFHYIGKAPMRFIVRASLLDESAEAPAGRPGGPPESSRTSEAGS